MSLTRWIRYGAALLVSSAMPISAQSACGLAPDGACLEGAARVLVPCTEEQQLEDGSWRRVTWNEEWDPARTAVIICDMWDHHWCPTAEARLVKLIPPMNAWLNRLRAVGVRIIHCPADTMGFYENTPQRERARQAPCVPLIGRLNRRSVRKLVKAQVEADSEGTNRAQQKFEERRVWTRQHPDIIIGPEDAIAERREPLWLLIAEGRTHVVIAGVHTNRCVFSRPFGIRSLLRVGLKTVLARDLTDGFFKPNEPDGPEHDAQQSLVIEEMERYWCPTTVSEQMQIIAAPSAL
jgi:nicotinamidase-related amidase